MVALNQSFIDASIDAEPSLLDGLTEDQQTRLTEQLDRYLVGLENGQPLDVDELSRANPDIAPVFHAYLEKLNALYGVAVGFNAQNFNASGIDESLAAIATGTMQLGDFTITREIGRGGMGIVYEAMQESLNRRVAIKLLPIASLLDSKQIVRFKNEAHAAGLLQHPNIVPVHSVGSEKGIHYYAMQLIDGESVDAWLAKHESSSGYDAGVRGGMERTDWRTILKWTIDIADALHAAHETGVVHRDVKPSNLMLDQNEKIWITDFGLARCQTEVSLTRSGDVIGTMRYMSPEQARGQTALVDSRTDVYSLAATAYEMLTLRPAHQGNDAPTILKMIDQHEITPLRQLRSDLPRDLETVIAKALSKNRDGRYETGADFADDLRRVLSGEPTMARPPTVLDRIGRLASRYRTTVLSVAAVGLLGLVGLATSTAMIANQMRVSEANANRAFRNEQLWRDAVDRLGSQMAELLEGIPAAGPVRSTLLKETLGYYQTFAAIADNDPSSKQDIAITFGKIGGLQSELGETADAIDSLRRSETLYAELAESDDSIRPDWATSQNNLAQALAKSGQLAEAARFFARAIGSQREWLAAENLADTERHQARLALATTLNNLGLLLADSMAIDEAEKTYLEAVSLLETDPRRAADAETQQQLATVFSNLSGLLAKQAPERAIDYAGRALSQQTDALESDPGNAKLATQVVVTLNTLGASQSSAGQLDEAIDTFGRGIEIARQLLVRWPDQPTYQRDLVIGLNHLGLAYSQMGELQRAAQTFQEALDQGRPLALEFGSDAEIQSMLGGVLNNLGFLQQQLGQNEAASVTYQDAIKAQSLAVRLAPEVKRYRQFLRKHRENYRAVTNGRGDS
ncbi:serine/threonine-protein kinase [Stieleria varia]|uniref:Serine/threonine-protein kinase PrkC n=1 Tax=Stieleria varia TaxID=2528005 RepID=A0A5C6A0Q8_9BACT|nr:serine/threonine-protein kinase [Stieleria varia]TWT92788.1 Serine/threonine-protein kinase PrkC [Stieleria varia]